MGGDVRGWWFVVHGRGGDVSSAVLSSLATLEEMRVGVLTIDDSIRNNDKRHCCCLLFGCHVALGDVAPANRPVWSLVSESGWSEAVIQHKNIQNNDKRQHRRRSSFGCHVALSDVAPATPPHPAPSIVTWHCTILLWWLWA